MNTSRRRVLLGSASAAVATAIGRGAFANIPIELGESPDTRTLLARVVRVMYPHDNFPDAFYERSADGIFATAGKTTGQKVMLASGLQDLDDASFREMDDAAALAHLKGIEETQFFIFVRGNAILTLYDDPEVWTVLGYEGPSFDQGGYINRGFNDLDWLPDPRIEEYAGVGQ